MSVIIGKDKHFIEREALFSLLSCLPLSLSYFLSFCVSFSVLFLIL